MITPRGMLRTCAYLILLAVTPGSMQATAGVGVPAPMLPDPKGTNKSRFISIVQPETSRAARASASTASAPTNAGGVNHRSRGA